MSVFRVRWQEDGAAVVLARVCGHDATGSATGVDGEGYWFKQADISSITCKVFAADDSETAVVSPTVTIASVILDTPVTSAALWDVDSTGYNFKHLLAATSFPTGNKRYIAEYLFTTTGGYTFPLVADGVAEPLITS